MKQVGLKLRISLASIIIMFINFGAVVILALNLAESKISAAMMEQLIPVSTKCFY